MDRTMVRYLYYWLLAEGSTVSISDGMLCWWNVKGPTFIPLDTIYPERRVGWEEYIVDRS